MHQYAIYNICVHGSAAICMQIKIFSIRTKQEKYPDISSLYLSNYCLNNLILLKLIEKLYK